jgi:hypothetical protein
MKNINKQLNAQLKSKLNLQLHSQLDIYSQIRLQLYTDIRDVLRFQIWLNTYVRLRLQLNRQQENNI